MITGIMRLRKKNPKLKILLAFGGWNFNKPGLGTEHIFSSMAKNAANRKVFINSVLEFLEEHGFDGIDFDWEYPLNYERGGEVTDKAGFAALVNELREAADKARRPNFIISAAVGASAYGWSGIDVQKISKSIDFLNLMAYDIHGAWESATNFHTPWKDGSGVDVHTAIRHYLDAGLPARKLNLGLAAYGRNWEMSTAYTAGQLPPVGTSAKWTGHDPEGPYSGGPGRCTCAPGFLSFGELQTKIADGARVHIDADRMASYMVHGKDWIAFDTLQSAYMKIKQARALGLGGLMSWAGDLDDEKYSFHRLMKSQSDPGPFKGRIAKPGNKNGNNNGGKKPSPKGKPYKGCTRDDGVCLCKLLNKGDGTFAVPYDCSKFVQCVHVGNAWQGYIKSCMTGLMWDVTQNVCNHAVQTQCGSRPKP